MGEREMVEQLLDFDRAKVRRQDCLVTWKEIADELGVSEDTLQRWCKAMGIEFPRFGPSSSRARVYLPKTKITVLRTLYLA